jgi:hypothetical protein
MKNNDNTTEMTPKPYTYTPNPVGRPSGYTQAHAITAHKLCLLGCHDERIAEILNISHSTINQWKLDYPEFSNALKDGRADADSTVASALYTKAINGDTTAMIFWLKNRQKEYWRDKQDIVISGNVSIMALSEADIDAELAAIRARLDNIIDITPEPKQIEGGSK